jgi:hypothetical protein
MKLDLQLKEKSWMALVAFVTFAFTVLRLATT